MSKSARAGMNLALYVGQEEIVLVGDCRRDELESPAQAPLLHLNFGARVRWVIQ
jgi:hypothetical protein